MFASDTPTKSTCTGSCLSFWPPLDGKATAGSGVTASQLGTITGTNGAAQVTYAGHPLYYYAADTKPGDVKGQGSNQSGALWWILTPSGAPIESKAPAGGGGGY
jgi:predicted lipoprotein with Yx(FWY)xxD motif